MGEEITMTLPYSDSRFLIARADGTQSHTLTDADLWGIYNCIQHALDDGYLEAVNAIWGQAVLERIRKLRGIEE